MKYLYNRLANVPGAIKQTLPGGNTVLMNITIYFYRAVSAMRFMERKVAI